MARFRTSADMAYVSMLRAAPSWAYLGGACTAVETRWRVIQHALFSCVATCHHLCPVDLWHDIAGLLPEDAQEARAALERAQGCNLENAELVAAYCVPWLVHPTSQLPQVPCDVK